MEIGSMLFQGVVPRAGKAGVMGNVLAPEEDISFETLMAMVLAGSLFSSIKEIPLVPMETENLPGDVITAICSLNSDGKTVIPESGGVTGHDNLDFGISIPEAGRVDRQEFIGEMPETTATNYIVSGSERANGVVPAPVPSGELIPSHKGDEEFPFLHVEKSLGYSRQLANGYGETSVPITDNAERIAPSIKEKIIVQDAEEVVFVTTGKECKEIAVSGETASKYLAASTEGNGEIHALAGTSRLVDEEDRMFVGNYIEPEQLNAGHVITAGKGEIVKDFSLEDNWMEKEHVQFIQSPDKPFTLLPAGKKINREIAEDSVEKLASDSIAQVVSIETSRDQTMAEKAGRISLDNPDMLARFLWSKAHDGLPKSVQISLDPPDLGNLRVFLTARGQDVSVKFVTSNYASYQVLQGAANHLAKSFSSHGLLLAGFVVDHGMRDQGKSNADPGEKKVSANRRRYAVPALEITETARTVPRGTGVFDYLV